MFCTRTGPVMHCKKIRCFTYSTTGALYNMYNIQVIKTLMLLAVPFIGWLKTICYLIEGGVSMVTLCKYIFFISEQ